MAFIVKLLGLGPGLGMEMKMEIELGMVRGNLRDHEFETCLCCQVKTI